MQEAERQPAEKPKFTPIIEEQSFFDVLRSLLGKTITVVNPESYEDAPVGHQIRVGFYKARLVGLGKDYLILLTEFVHAGRQTAKEPVKQFVPLENIKRISVMKSEKLLHL